MMTLDIVLLQSSNCNELDTYRSRRKIQDLTNELKDCKIFLHEADLQSLNLVKFHGEFFLMLLAGDFVEKSYLEKIIQFSGEDSVIFQPLYTYTYNQVDRCIYKNIDIHRNLAVFDVLALRYYASRHIVSRTVDFRKFLQEQKNVDYNIWWSYLLWLLINCDKQLACINHTISFEQIIDKFHTREAKLMNSEAPSPIFDLSFSYDEVLSRQNMNNVGIEECSLRVQQSTTSIPAINQSSNTLDPLIDDIKRPVSHHNLQTAIAENGVVKGTKLTSARLFKRAKDRANQNSDIKQVFLQTLADVKETIQFQ